MNAYYYFKNYKCTYRLHVYTLHGKCALASADGFFRLLSIHTLVLLGPGGFSLLQRLPPSLDRCCVFGHVHREVEPSQEDRPEAGHLGRGQPRMVRSSCEHPPLSDPIEGPKCFINNRRLPKTLTSTERNEKRQIRPGWRPH